ncbi:hypothetical protein ONZ45_g5734 [Pleurotus djamor]|nr:hypothetical protein ONZ45_g5734 [Pleurotus djamor]
MSSHSDSPEPDDSEGESEDKKARKYVCQHAGCFKAYRQLSGLRYHRKHGHPPDLPVQLEVVPPTLAAQLPARTKKMRRTTQESK